ncbi:hypothetical protein ACIRQH_34880 [Streptomyces sp. NPDC102279]|uniref:hypothetical protein n=1 Tax=Streptomyces sp. NPDC102279 TaxID=3366153 RepID=UPI00382E18C7
MTHGTSRTGPEPTPTTVATTPALVAQYAAAMQKQLAIQRRIGKDYDLTAEWRQAQRTCDRIWTEARDAGHTVDELLAASRALDVTV